MLDEIRAHLSRDYRGKPRNVERFLQKLGGHFQNHNRARRRG
jgi:hypothetical protein